MMTISLSKLVIPTLLGFLFSSSPKSTEKAKQQDSYVYLDRLAVSAGTDKGSNFHDYTKIYAQYLSSLKNEPISFLEIGIYKGNSVKLWESYFTKADLHFIDIAPSLIEYHSTRSHYHFIDQGNRAELQTFIESIKGGFDVIIDDGGHKAAEQIISFQTLFPHLKAGGLYIIEDLHADYLNDLANYGKICIPTTHRSCKDFLKTLLDDLNYASSLSQCADHNKLTPETQECLNYFQKNIGEMHFYPSLCIIIKK